ncbi:hypothetical protein PTTG_30189, partial [Puccinia triticina 1-1 BBBD Race 1]
MERKKFAKRTGARWSVLNELPYWRPIQHCSIELMHSLVLGDLKDHSIQFLSLPAAGALLSSMQELDEAWQNNQSYTEAPFNERVRSSRKSKGKRKLEDSTTETAAVNRPGKRSRRLTSAVGDASNLESLQASPFGAHARSDSSSTSTHSYALRLRKKTLYNKYSEEDLTNSGEDTGSEHTVTGRQRNIQRTCAPVEDKKRPKLLPEELDFVQHTIMHTILPSWIDRVPRNLGAESHGSLKAAEWLILYKVYYPMALIPLWVKSIEEAGTQEGETRISALLDSTSTLLQIAHFLTLPKILGKDLKELDNLILGYRSGLGLHDQQQHGRKSGSMACCRDDIPKTLLHKWHVNSNFGLVLNNTPAINSSLEEANADTGTRGRLILDPPMLQKWRRAVSGVEGTRTKLVLTQALLNLNPAVEVIRSSQIDHKTFTARQHHEGNSLVEFHLGKDQQFGQIEQIFQSDQTPQRSWLVVNPFKELQRIEDPYGEYLDLNCRLVKANHDASVLIGENRVIGHVAIMRNIAGTFGVASTTISAVGLGTS